MNPIQVNNILTPIIISPPQGIQANHWYSKEEDCFRLKANLLVEDVTNSKKNLIWITQEAFMPYSKRNQPYTPRDLVNLLTDIFRHEIEEQLGLEPHSKALVISKALAEDLTG